MSRERELRERIPLEGVLPQGPLIGEVDGRTSGWAGVATEGPRPFGVHRQHRGDKVRDERGQRRDPPRLVTGADPVGLEPDPTFGAAGFADAVDEDMGPRPVGDPFARDQNNEAQVSKCGPPMWRRRPSSGRGCRRS